MGRAKKIICVETGKIYNSAREAAKDVGLKDCTNIIAVCKGRQPATRGLHFKYYEDLDLPGEIWKNAKCDKDGLIYDFSDTYLVSNMGRIKEKDTGNITYGYNAGQEYLYIQINKISFGVHRIVATTFIPNLENKPTVDHINTVRTDNRVSNLRWFDRNEQINGNEITKEKVSEISKINVKKAHESIKKKVKCIETGIVYESVSDAAKHVNLYNGSGISACCRKNQETAASFHWEYFED